MAHGHSQAHFESLLAQAHRRLQLAASLADIMSRRDLVNELDDMRAAVYEMLQDELKRGKHLRTRP